MEFNNITYLEKLFDLWVRDRLTMIDFKVILIALNSRYGVSFFIISDVRLEISKSVSEANPAPKILSSNQAEGYLYRNLEFNPKYQTLLKYLTMEDYFFDTINSEKYSHKQPFVDLCNECFAFTKAFQPEP